MIDYFALTLGHGLLLYAFWRLFVSTELDADPARAKLNASKSDARRARSAAGRARIRQTAARDDEGDAR